METVSEGFPPDGYLEAREQMLRTARPSQIAVVSECSADSEGQIKEKSMSLCMHSHTGSGALMTSDRTQRHSNL